MAKLTFTEFVKYAQAYEAYAAAPEGAPAVPKAPAPEAKPEVPAPEVKPESKPETPAPAAQPDLSSIEASLNSIMSKLNAAPTPSMSDVKPVGLDDIMQKIFN